MSVDPVHPQVLGLDLSLTSTGLALPDGSVEVYRPKAYGKSNLGLDRLVEIRDRIVKAVFLDVELTVIEALAFDAHDTNRLQAQLAGIVRAKLFDLGTPFLCVPPGTLKKYATGNGHAGKTEMVQAAEKRLGYAGHDDNEADALWLRAIGCELLAVPLVDMPQANRDALRLLRQQRPVKAEPW
jgi:Holliday junction resolvasome RuvABC endonuclease subunit